MRNDAATIHGAGSSSIRIVLVLFILLVIVTGMFSWNQYRNELDEGGSSGIESAQGFTIYNQTSDYTLYLSSFANIQNPGIRIVNSGASQSLVLLGSYGSVSYLVRNSSTNAQIGSFSAVLNSTSGFTVNAYSGRISADIPPLNRFQLIIRSVQ